jgi:hypothetical protein
MRYIDFDDILMKGIDKKNNKELKNAIMKACQGSNESVESMLSNASLINHVA